MNRKILLIFIIANWISMGIAHADTISGKVTSVKVSTSSSRVLFQLTSNETGSDCNKSGWFLVQTSKPGGSHIFDMLMLAYTEHLSVNVLNKESVSCDIEPDALTVESISFGVDKETMAEESKKLGEKSKILFNKSK